MNRSLLICFILFAAFLQPVLADDCTRYGDETYGYSICAPAGWNKSYKDIGYKHILTLTRGSSEIVSSASRMDDEENAKWKSWKKWYLKGIGGSLMSIIETKEVRAGRDATIKLIVFQYRKGDATLLQRSMLMKYGDNLLVVECRAPIGSFSRHTDLFNGVMSSVDVSNVTKGNSMDVLRTQRKAERKKTAKRETREKEAIKGGSETGANKMRDLEKKGIIERIEKGGAPEGEEAKPDQKEKQEPQKEDRQVRKEEPKPDTSADSMERKKTIEAELKKLDDLEKKGVIEKVEESGK